MERANNQINGVVVLNKPTGMNSMTAVKRVQRLLGASKAGHLGTLDPFASGVLPIALGKATKLFESHLKDGKTYRAIFKFGFESDTADSEGKILTFDDVQITKEQVVEKIKEFVGEFDQMPPIYSAKKINGKKAYELAREGKEVVLKTKRITIFKFDLIQQLAKNTFLFEIVSSSGTYIRSCCTDLAKSLSTVGVMTGLIRTKSGSYDIADSVTLDEISEKSVIYEENH